MKWRTGPVNIHHILNTRVISVLKSRELGKRVKARAAATLATRWLESFSRGGDCLVFSSDPLIIYTPDWVMRSHPAALYAVLRNFRQQIVYILLNLSWTHEQPRLINQALQWQKKHLRLFPKNRIVFLANTETECRLLEDAGATVAWVHQNAFVSPDAFQPLPESTKRFDAVYDAKINPFKRHHLAAGIESLALITARIAHQHDEAYTRRVHEMLPQAYWFNDPLAADYRYMRFPEINEAINQCRVGLCLSSQEGAMFASIQYLLAGLPVVSTRSLGGRDEFFHPDYVRIVEDNPEAVANGVREMRNCPVLPEEIRLRTMENIEQHKTRLFDLLVALCESSERRADFVFQWPSWTSSPLHVPTARPADIRRRIENAVTRRACWINKTENGTGS